MRLPATTIAANGAPPAAAACLYPGRVMHARLRPLQHRFAYRVLSLLIDVDRLAEADRLSPLFSVDRWNLFAFRRRDHGAADGSALRPWVERLLSEAGAPAPARILLLCTPRVLGLGFDPLAIYTCLDEAGHVTAIVYAVRNTFGERHAYVAPVRPGEATAAGIVQRAPKRFYVSPFIDMAQTYVFHVLPPGDAVRVRILERDAAGPTLAAAWSGTRRALTTRALLASFARMPFHAVKVLAGIHVEALRLWLKGAPLHAHRPAREATTVLPDNGRGRPEPVRGAAA